jgi:antitoxin StbD
MKRIYANYTASITELKQSPSRLLEKAGNEPIAILNHNKPSAYLVPTELYEKMMDLLDDLEFSKEVKERLNYDENELIEVDVDELV